MQARPTAAFIDELCDALRHLQLVTGCDDETLRACVMPARHLEIRHLVTGPEILHILADVCHATRRPIGAVTPWMDRAATLRDEGHHPRAITAAIRAAILRGDQP